MSSSSWMATIPANRRIALRSQRRPKSKRSAPTTPFSRCSGTTVTIATPSVPMITASAAVAATVPRSGARHPRVTPTARTMVVASTNSTALATKAGVAWMARVTGSTAELSPIRRHDPRPQRGSQELSPSVSPMSDRDLAIIVPVHNELGNIAPFYDRTCAVLDSLSAISRQMVFVNDGSDDGSLERICELRAQDKRVQVLSLSRDFGYHAVLLAGLSLITADRYAMIDVDCEDPPELLREFHSALEGGADVAYGIRSNRVEPMVVTFFRRLFYYLNKGIADSDIVLWMAEFAMISRQVRDAIVAPHTTYVFLRAELGYVGFVRVGVPYVRGVRTSGKSHYNFFNMTRFAVAGFLASSTFPLRLILYLAVVVGFLFPLVAIVAGLGAAGIASLASVATFYFALIALSTIALYLARAYKNGVARPVFAVAKNTTHL